MLFALYCTPASSVPQGHLSVARHSFHRHSHNIHNTTHKETFTDEYEQPLNVLLQDMTLNRLFSLSPAYTKLWRDRAGRTHNSNNKNTNVWTSLFPIPPQKNRLLTDGTAGNRLRETEEGLIGFWWSSPTDATMSGSHGTKSVFFHYGCLPLILMNTHCTYTYTHRTSSIYQSVALRINDTELL